MIRAVLDSNVIVSALLGDVEEGYGAPKEILRRARRHEFQVMLSAAIRDEVARVIRTKPYLRRHLPPPMFEQSMMDLVKIGSTVETLELIPGVAPHRHDDPILATVAASGADWFVTGDQQLLAMREYAGVPFTDPNGFLAALDADK